MSANYPSGNGLLLVRKYGRQIACGADSRVVRELNGFKTALASISRGYFELADLGTEQAD